MSEIARLRLVLAVARTRSISEAAAVHGVSQPTVTRAVAALEDQLGLRVFDRSSAGSIPTAQAAEALEQVGVIVAAYDDLLALGGTQPTVLRFAHDEDIPAMLDSAIARWNREKSIPAEVVLVADPVAVLRAGDADFAVTRVTGRLAGLDGEPVRYVRDLRIDLLSRAPSTSLVRAFLNLLG